MTNAVHPPVKLFQFPRMCDGPFVFGDEPTGVDAIVFGALATSVLTPIESPIRDFLRSQPACVTYVDRMRPYPTSLPT